jgi:anti-sigma factor RsiW
MTCREFVEFLMAYLDDELDAGLRDRFAEHIEACPPCKDYLESYRRTVALGRSLCDRAGSDAPVPEEVPEELVRAILALRS